MRQQMIRTLAQTLERDERLAVVLADISVSLLKDVKARYPERVINVGIMEQTLVSVAAGMALEGFIPVVHSIAPFLVERPFEQLKDDFCYQRLGGNFISNGASYDYSTEGMTHQGPGDVQILRSLPGMQIVVPGTPNEFDRLFCEAYNNGSPTYYRTSEARNPIDYPVRFGKLEVLQEGKEATVVVVGPALRYTLPAVKDLDVAVLYCTTVAPFDAETLYTYAKSNKIVLVEPYYEGVLVPDIQAAMRRIPIAIETIGVPHELLLHYGTPGEYDTALGFTPERVRESVLHFLKE